MSVKSEQVGKSETYHLPEDVELVREIRKPKPHSRDLIAEYKPLPLDQVPPHAIGLIKDGVGFVTDQIGKGNRDTRSFHSYNIVENDPKSEHVSFVVRAKGSTA